MKKYLFLVFNLLIFSSGKSQNISDALRYSMDNTNGTARFRAMSGAFGAVGGDLSSLNVNPAGSAIFTNNQIGFTLNNNNETNTSNYFQTVTKASQNSFNLNQGGGVFVFKTQDPKNNWKTISVGVNYENTNNYNNSVVSRGTNPTNSVANYFLSYANKANNGAPVPLDLVSVQTDESQSSLYSYLGGLPNVQYSNINGFDAQQAFLGYQAFVINALDNNNPNTSYTSNVATGGNYFQRNSNRSEGYSGKLSFNGATSYKDKLFLGLNLNSHFLDYRNSSVFFESNSNPLGPLVADQRVVNVQFRNELYTSGTGFSFQLGSIYKITKELRVGLAYESSTWFHLSEELTQDLSAVSASSAEILDPDVVNLGITNVYEPYTLKTPSKLTGSLAYVFGKKGLLSIDYTVKNYANTKFNPQSDPFFSALNNQIATTLRSSTSELRVGGEYKIKEFSLRAGYRYEQSPYKNKLSLGDLAGYSGGIGYDFGSTKADLSYSHTSRTGQQSFFNQGLTDLARINTQTNVVTFTLLFEL